ncbi:hypothetical protein E2C01_076985 [Portunus trituberculatus]|uniref:Uncharacterized protein n=1 Tax=Portunus trituberculatus TaxID=210409 RepID=A0A5B7IKJ0_PORTR|nr:hypothetical protein [Portunus trituberculatus]
MRGLPSHHGNGRRDIKENKLRAKHAGSATVPQRRHKRSQANLQPSHVNKTQVLLYT